VTQGPTHAVLPDRPRVAMMGDSVISGYGVGGRSYAQLVGERLDADRIMCYARSTFTVVDAVRLIERVKKFAPDLVILNVGGSDGLVHAGKSIERLLEKFAPKSWQGVQGLEPLARLDSSLRRRIRQKITGTIKLVLKHIGVRLTGGFRRVEPDVFEQNYFTLMDELQQIGCVVVVVGLHIADEFLWPGSVRSQREYEAASRRVLQAHPFAITVDPKPVLVRWDDYLDDHAHLNEQGHEKMCELVLSHLRTHASVRPAV
jgi:lysophospholipase L1-like esterase